MSIDKALTSPPQGLGDLPNASEPALEIVIVADGEESKKEEEQEEEDFNENLAEKLHEGALIGLASELIAKHKQDVGDRKDWLETYVKGLKLLGLKYDDRTEPWIGACGVHHPLLMESATKFQSETIMETFPAAGPVKTTIIGKETPEKVASSIRVKNDMNYELTEGMPEYRPEHERMLLSLCLSGNAFKKIYYDPSLDRPTAPYIPAEDVVVPYGATSIEAAERVVHRMRKTKNELRRLQIAGFYRDIDLGDPVQVMDEVEKQKAMETGFTVAVDKRFQILEMHVNLDLEGYEDKDEKGEETGIELPYVVTIEEGTATVLAVRRNWIQDDSLKLRRQHFVHYGYIPGFGFYYFGLIHLIGGHARAATSLLRQLIDAGTLSNLPGGLKANGLRIKGDDTPIAPGEWRDVDIPSGPIKDNILPLPYKEPSQVLLALMNQVIEDGRRFAAVADLKVSDMSSQSPVGTTLAILERVLKVMSAVQARIHYTMKQEFKLLAAIIRDNTPEDYDYEPELGSASAKRADYDCCDVIPVSDPNASTMSQRVVQYQAVLQLSQTAPQIYDLPFLHRQMIETLGVKNSQKIVPMKDDMKPLDPVSENMAILMGKPTRAFMYQDHDAHLGVHMAALQDPKIQQIASQNPQQAQVLMGAAHAHIMEHVAFKYRKDLEQQLGASLPPPPDFFGEDLDVGHLPPEVEVRVSALAAQAAGKLLQKDKQEAAAQQAQQQAQDPLIQMQQQELQLKAQELQLKQQDMQQKAQIAQLQQQLAQRELEMEQQIKQAEQQRKGQKDVMDASAKKDDLDLRRQQMQIDAHGDGAKLGAQIAQQRQQAETSRMQEEGKQHAEGAKLGADIAKTKLQTAADLHKHSVDTATSHFQHSSDQAADLHKHVSGQSADLRKHASSLNTELHKHETQQDLDLHKHESQMEHDERMEKMKAEQAKLAAKEAAKNKPKPGATKK